MFGPVKEGGWRKRYNLELYNLYDEPGVVTFINLKRLEWVGPVSYTHLDVYKRQVPP